MDKEEKGMLPEYERIKKIRAIALYYGVGNQIIKTCEELGELLTALSRYMIEAGKNKEDASKNDVFLSYIVQEIADVQIMILQITGLLGINDNVQDFIDYKLDRQLKRIEAERGGKVE